MFKTLEASLKTKLAVIVKETPYTHKGQDRVSMKVRKANGNKLFSVVKYENGLYSSAV